MLENEYRSWLTSQGKEASTLNTSVSTIRRIENAYGDLQQEFDLSGLDTIIEDLTYSKADQRSAEPNPSKLVIDGDNVTARPFTEPRSHRAPIDMFFRSVAAGRGDGVGGYGGHDGALAQEVDGVRLVVGDDLEVGVVPGARGVEDVA